MEPAIRKTLMGLAASLLACAQLSPAAALAASVRDRSEAPESTSSPPEPCGAEADIQPQSAIHDRYTGADAVAFLLGIGAVDETSRLSPSLTVVVLSGDEVFGGNAAFIATDACFRGGPLFFDPIRYRLGRSLVARRHAGLPIRLAALEQLAAKGDAGAQLLAGSLREMAVPGTGRALLQASARQGQALAMLELGYLVSGLDQLVVEEHGPMPTTLAAPDMVPVGSEIPPVRFQLAVPGMDRAAGYCWLKAAVAVGDSTMAALGTQWLDDLNRRMTTLERDAARAQWDRNAAAAPADMCT